MSAGRPPCLQATSALPPPSHLSGGAEPPGGRRGPLAVTSAALAAFHCDARCTLLLAAIHDPAPAKASLSALPLGRALALLLLLPAPGAAQAAGSLFGRVAERGGAAPVVGATVRVTGLPLQTVTDELGRFVLAAVPAGERIVRVEHLGHAPLEVGVTVRAERPLELRLELTPRAVAVEGLIVEAERFRLIEPDVRLSHEVVGGRELRELPLDAVEEALELAPGVSDGHFRGGRSGQESYVVDGLEVKNALDASTAGPGLELSPTSLEEVDVVTGGFGAAYGSALSGVVRYVTRRGDTDRWRGRAAFRTDHWAPEGLFRGFNGLSVSAGGPVSMLGSGATLFADVLAHGLADADPRARGLTCLRAEDAAPDALADTLRGFQGDPARAALLCPFTSAAIPHQPGDKLIGFLRFDRPLPAGLAVTATLLRSRAQQGLYTPAFKYNPRFQLGSRATGSLGSVALTWARQGSRAWYASARVAAVRMDRQVGALEVAALESVGGLSLAPYRFLGEDYVRGDIEGQLAAPRAVPGYRAAGSGAGTPFGPGAEGIFVTDGTPDLAAWSRSDALSADLSVEALGVKGDVVRAGLGGKLHGVESYERVLAHLPGSLPYYARFYPASGAAYVEGRWRVDEEVVVEAGARVDAFRAGLGFQEDRFSEASAVVEPGWRLSVSPRLGVALPLPGSGGRTALRLAWGLVSQPPDFRYFLDTAVGDSLRTDVLRQGNPVLGFERGAAYEAAVTHLLTPSLSVGLTGFRKELKNLVSGARTLAETGEGVFTTGDFGTVQGVETSVRGSWPGLRLRVGWALQEAVGVSSTAFDPLDPDADPDAAPVQYPLAFDRRHSVDVALAVAQAAGASERAWGAAVTGRVASGYPLDRRLAGGAATAGAATAYLPWTAILDARVTRDLGTLPGCGGCRWRALADGRNLLGRANVVALRRDSGTLAPPLTAVLAQVDQAAPLTRPIPRESPRYAPAADLDGDGLITSAELRSGRLAALLDRGDPTLFLGEARQLRLGVEVTF